MNLEARKNLDNAKKEAEEIVRRAKVTAASRPAAASKGKGGTGAASKGDKSSKGSLYSGFTKDFGTSAASKGVRVSSPPPANRKGKGSGKPQDTHFAANYGFNTSPIKGDEDAMLRVAERERELDHTRNRGRDFWNPDKADLAEHCAACEAGLTPTKLESKPDNGSSSNRYSEDLSRWDLVGKTNCRWRIKSMLMNKGFQLSFGGNVFFPQNYQMLQNRHFPSPTFRLGELCLYTDRVKAVCWELPMAELLTEGVIYSCTGASKKRVCLRRSMRQITIDSLMCPKFWLDLDFEGKRTALNRLCSRVATEFYRSEVILELDRHCQVHSEQAACLAHKVIMSYGCPNHPPTPWWRQGKARLASMIWHEMLPSREWPPSVEGARWPPVVPGRSPPASAPSAAHEETKSDLVPKAPPSAAREATEPAPRPSTSSAREIDLENAVRPNAPERLYPGFDNPVFSWEGGVNSIGNGPYWQRYIGWRELLEEPRFSVRWDPFDGSDVDRLAMRTVLQFNPSMRGKVLVHSFSPRGHNMVALGNDTSTEFLEFFGWYRHASTSVLHRILGGKQRSK